MFEALVKLVCGIALAGAVHALGQQSLAETGTVFGIAVTADTVETVLAQLTAAAASGE